MLFENCARTVVSLLVSVLSYKLRKIANTRARLIKLLLDWRKRELRRNDSNVPKSVKSFATSKKQVEREDEEEEGRVVEQVDVEEEVEVEEGVGVS